MISDIAISRVATYGEDAQSLTDLSTFNYVFGPNGSGKTTISRIIANEAAYPHCAVSWSAGTKLDVLVYNRDFVDRNFTQGPRLKGIFTLGQEHVEAAKKVEELKKKMEEMVQQIKSLKITLEGDDGQGGKVAELKAVEDALSKKCWEQKQKHDWAFAAAFEGCRGSAEKFKKKVLAERSSNQATVESLDALQKKATTVFGTTPTNQPLLPSIDQGRLAELGTDPILKRRVIGKNDVDIAALILRLGNSDWVKQGREFYPEGGAACPFCQQPTDASLAEKLNEYFDETFVKETEAIATLATQYSLAAERLKKSLDTLLAIDSPYLDKGALKPLRETLAAQLGTNVQRLEAKQKEPSQVVELESIAGALASAASLVEAANKHIAEHNITVANIGQERATLTAEVWKHLIAVELKDALADYDSKKAAIDKARKSIEEQSGHAQKAYSEKITELRQLEKGITSIQPTIDTINDLLHSFGFRGFKLAKAGEEENYKIIRADGSDAKESLSEGEKTFITFLYFYHLLKGSNSDNGTVTDRVVVIDDPVSSLDSDILFIVSSLIKILCQEVRDKKTSVKQVFVLTHNVYFHKEVTFNAKRRGGGKMREETFWTVRKSDEMTRIVCHLENPITSHYDLLWADVRRGDRDNHSIQNTLRKILENYFKFFGGVNPEDICTEFQGSDHLTCRSLLSWVNDGSHFAQDDLYHAIDDAMVERYLRVFRLIFEKTGHTAHYDMMMRTQPDAAPGNTNGALEAPTAGAVLKSA